MCQKFSSLFISRWLLLCLLDPHGVKYLRELAVRERIHSDPQTSIDAAEVPCTMDELSQKKTECLWSQMSKLKIKLDFYLFLELKSWSYECFHVFTCEASAIISIFTPWVEVLVRFLPGKIRLLHCESHKSLRSVKYLVWIWLALYTMT